MLDAARGGDGRLVVVEGSAGIGKTRLLAEARALAQAAEFEVLDRARRRARGRVRVRDRAAAVRGAAGRGDRRSSAPSCWPVPPSSARRFRVGADEPRRETAPSRRSRCCTASIGWPPTSRRARRRCSSSTTCTGRTSRRCAGLSTSPAGSRACRCCCSSGRGRPSRPTRRRSSTELLADPLGVVIRPGSLGQESAAALARERLGSRARRGFAAALQTGSGGNPLYLVALLDAVWREGTRTDRRARAARPRARAAGDLRGVSTRLGPPAARRHRLAPRGGDPRRSHGASARRRSRGARPDSRADGGERARRSRPAAPREPARVHSPGRPHRRPRGA